MVQFSTPWKCHNTSGFLTFPGGIETEQWCEMCWWYSEAYKKSSTITFFQLFKNIESLLLKSDSLTFKKIVLAKVL